MFEAKNAHYVTRNTALMQPIVDPSMPDAGDRHVTQRQGDGMHCAPVIIVGVPRSGTTLLAAMLSAHSRMACGPETQFFTRLTSFGAEKVLEPNAWPDAAVSFARSLTLGSNKVLDLMQLPEEALRRALSGTEPSIATLFARIARQPADRQGKPRWIEKTPNHILHVREIRRLLPHARIIRIVRDARDVAVSMTKLPWAGPSLMFHAYLWRAWNAGSESFFASDRASATVKYEDLVRSPGPTLRRLCRFIGEDFEEEMLDTSRTGLMLATPEEWWKQQVAQGIDRSRVACWKTSLDERTARAIELVCSELLAAHGYEVHHIPKHTLFAQPWTRRDIEALEPEILALGRLEVRILSSSDQRGGRGDQLITGPEFWPRRVPAKLAAVGQLVSKAVWHRNGSVLVHPRALLRQHSGRLHRLGIWILERTCRPLGLGDAMSSRDRSTGDRAAP